ncbi:Mis12 protein-domain-containing protein [Apodospora peruviana]|uniref:Mis12 protein-domain-containing protein n=1 Tax=Apodospora peruviana TaxID=516989 RepID=A0AAE0ICG4_9PEZI|nr:Mis12 protein-domain-containing protein [Apodospora peruviana]
MAARSDIELLTEHFGYPPVSLLDDIINSINILAERALNSVEQGLLNAPPASLGFRPPTHVSSNDPNNPNGLPIAEEAHRHEIEAGTHQLETLLCASIDRNFDKFELYVMRYILCVAPDNRDWIRLSHYEGLDFSPSSTIQNGNRPTVESVNRLRRHLQASQKLNCMLHAEKARNAAMLAEVRRLVGRGNASQPTQLVKNETTQPQQQEDEGQKPPLGFLHNRGALTDGGAESPITTTTAFTLSQLQALRALSTSLRNLMPDLKGSDEGGDADDDETGKKSWRRQRLEYVETATRKHLENARGLELGKDGEVRDGDWQGEGAGRNLARGEVEGLEKVVSILGGSSSNDGDGDGDQRMDET